MRRPLIQARRATRLTLSVLLAIVAVGATPARAQTPSPSDDGTSTGPRIDLVDQTPFVAPTDTLRIALDVTGAPADAELTFTLWQSVTRPGTAAQSRFDEWVEGTAVPGDPFNSPRTFPLANLPPADGSGRVDAAFSIVPQDGDESPVGFEIGDPGVYPFTISLSTAGGGDELDRLTTYLVRLPGAAETAPPLDVAPIVALRAPVALAPDRSRIVAPGALGRIVTVVDTLAANSDVPLTLGATPETLEALLGADSIPTTGDGAPVTGRTLLDRLDASLDGRAVLGSPYVEVDVPAWTRSSMGTDLGYQLSHGANVTIADDVLPAAAPLDRSTWVADPGFIFEVLV